MCCCRGGLSAMAVGTLICVGPSSLPQPLRHSPLLRQVPLFPNSKSMSHFFHFLLTSAQIPPLLQRFRPLSTSSLPLPIVDRPHSATLCIASGIVQLRFLQINAIPRGLSVTDGTDHAEYCFSFPQSSLSRKAQTFSHVAHRHHLALNFILRRLVILPTLVGWGLRRGKSIYCFIREAHSHPVWRAVYHHHRPSLISRPQQSHSLRYSRTIACLPDQIPYNSTKFYCFS